MPPTVKPAGGLMAKYGQKLAKAVGEVKEKPIDMGRMELPGGIQNGIAQLSKAYFAQYENGANKGEYYFRAVGVVVEPKFVEVDGRQMKVEGLQTSIGPMPVCATKSQSGDVTPMEDNVFKITNEFKKLGLAEAVESSDGSDLEELATVAVEAAPYFSFSTTLSPEKKIGNQTYPARVWQNWNGIVENYSPEGGDDSVNDASEPDPEPTPPPVAKKSTTPAKPTPKPTPTKSQPAKKQPEPKPEDSVSVEDNLENLAQAATDEGDQVAAHELSDFLMEKGFTQEQIENTPSWSNLVEEYREHGGPAPESGDEQPAEEGEAAAEEETQEEAPKPKTASVKDRKKVEWSPQVDEVYIWTEVDAQGKPLKDPKTKKELPGKEVEITKVDAVNKKVHAKDLDTGKLILTPEKKIKLIPWEQLSVPK